MEGCSRRAAALPATKKEGAQSKAVDGYHLDKKRVGYLGREQQSMRARAATAVLQIRRRRRGNKVRCPPKFFPPCVFEHDCRCPRLLFSCVAGSDAGKPQCRPLSCVLP
jgi:hypothetical protein